MNLQLAVRKMGLPFVLLTQTEREREREKGASLNFRDCFAAPCVFELHYAGKIWRHYGRNIASLYTWMDFISLRHAWPGDEGGRAAIGRSGHMPRAELESEGLG